MTPSRTVPPVYIATRIEVRFGFIINNTLMIRRNRKYSEQNGPTERYQTTGTRQSVPNSQELGDDSCQLTGDLCDCYLITFSEDGTCRLVSSISLHTLS
jgi:hypothetical protein